ncbi:SPW repeat protein [Ramlibacter humi]|nr:SPW repeat protein [Ramlibacter humi]
MAHRTANKRWQDWLTLLLGIWLFVSPWLLGFRAELPNQSWNFFVIGAAFFVFSIAALNMRSLWEEWVNLALGIWMVVSPWVLRYSGNVSARDDAMAAGIVAVVLTVWSLVLTHELDREEHRAAA